MIKNRECVGWSYDNAGNLLNDGYHSYSYQGENKISKVDGASAYVYNGEGQRVRKLVGESTRFIYGIGAQLIAEFDGATGNLRKEYVYGGASLITIEPTAVNSNGTQYTTADTLGSPRVITKAGGIVASRHDYQPFGTELGAGVGGRTVGMGFSNSGDTNRKKFTQYERDTETGLDYAQARYFSSLQGRFTTADPLMASALPNAPQTWNRYSYGLNNPLKYVDPSGLNADDIGTADDQRRQQEEQRRQQSAQGQPNPVTTVSATLPQEEIPMCAPDDLPTTVTVSQVNSPDSVQFYEVRGSERLRIGVDLTFTFTNAAGEPVDGTVSESVETLEGDPVDQDPRNMPLVNGTVSDTIATPGYAVPRGEAAERALIADLNRPFVTRQLITVTLTTSNGTRVQVTQERTLTNRAAGAGRIAGGHIGGYTFTMGQPQITLLP